MAYYIVKKYIVEEFQVQADSLKEARNKEAYDPNKVTVIKETVRKVKSVGK